MNRTRDDLYLRSDLIGKVQRGKLSPQEAEAEAQKLGIGALAAEPDSSLFDPMAEPFWTPPMAVAWISYRTANAVTEWWDRYREQCWDWHFHRSRLGPDGPIEEGHLLEQRKNADLATLCIAETYYRILIDGVKPMMSAADGQEALLVALRTDCFRATGINSSTGLRATILPIEWIDMEVLSDGRQDYFQVGASATSVRYRDVLLPAGNITILWPAPKPKAREVLPPLVRPEGSGFMPVFCAAQWIASQGGTVDFDPSNIEGWRLAFQELLDRVSSGEVRISGLRDNTREPINGVVFAGCEVDYPYSDRAVDLSFSDIYYLQSYPYLNEEHWRNGFDDSFRNRSDIRWKLLMVAKADILHFWPFERGTPTKSGTVGRPTSMHLIVAEFDERVLRGQVEVTLSKQAEVLADWMRQTHRSYPPAGRKAIENKLRDTYRRAKPKY